LVGKRAPKFEAFGALREGWHFEIVSCEWREVVCG